tara:strand:+ start:161 stop:1276 length:1116 start_codon:yes stop_codon:yes gene_type:complete
VNLLFIGPYRQDDGWGNAAKAYIRALAKIESVNLCIRPIQMGASVCDIDEDIIEFEYNSFDEYDIVIQNVLPSFCDYSDKFKKNICLAYTETNMLSETGWVQKLNLMDEVWVPSSQEKQNLLDSGVNVPISVTPIPLDIEKITSVQEELNINEIDESSFMFLVCGEFIERKNIPSVISAFHAEFSPQENVELLIKTNRSGVDGHQLLNLVTEKANNAKARLRMYPNIETYKNNYIITDKMQEEHLLALFKRADCFVMASHGESWCMPAAECMALGTPCIVTSHTGMTEFVNDENGWVVDSIETYVATKDAPLPYLYTAHETWRQVDSMELRKSMREAYEDSMMLTNKSRKCVEDIKKYSFECVAKTLEGLL